MASVELDLFDGLRAHVHYDLRALLADDDGLLAHASDHVEGLDGLVAEGDALGVGGDALLDDLADGLGSLEEAVGGDCVIDALVWPLEVIVGVDPEPQPLAQVVDGACDDAREELLLEVFPEGLELAEGLGVVRTGDDVLDALACELALEGALAPPRVELSPLVAENFPRGAVLGDGIAEYFQDLGAALRGVQPPADNVPRVVVEEGDEVDFLPAAGRPHGDVDLPELVGLRPLEEAHDLCALAPLFRLTFDEAGLVEGFFHLALGHGEEFRPAKPLGEAGDPEPGIFLLGLYDFLGERVGDGLGFGAGAAASHFRQPGLAAGPIDFPPLVDGEGGDAVDFRQLRRRRLPADERLGHGHPQLGGPWGALIATRSVPSVVHPGLLSALTGALWRP